MERRTEKHQALCDEIGRILYEKSPESAMFITMYSEYVHVVDDLVDEPKCVELVDKVTTLATQLFSSNYWTRNSQQLVLVEQLIHVFYFASVEWETSNEPWKRRDAKAMSHIGYSMLFAVMLLETKNLELVKKMAIQFMESCHLNHLNDMPPVVAAA